MKKSITNSILLFILIVATNTFCFAQHANSIVSTTPEKQLNIGDKKDGGIIFYIYKQGERGFIEGEIHGLIAAEKDIVDENGKSKNLNWLDAVGACEHLGSGWHLPFIEQLEKLYQAREIVGGFSRMFYWSLTEFKSNESARLISFGSGKQLHLNLKGYPSYARAVRSF